LKQTTTTNQSGNWPMMDKSRWHPSVSETASEMEKYDDLPPRIRRAIRECPVVFNAASVWRQMRAGYTQKQIIDAMRGSVKETIGRTWEFV
jgi:hypothetical protein